MTSSSTRKRQKISTTIQRDNERSSTNNDDSSTPNGAMNSTPNNLTAWPRKPTLFKKRGKNGQVEAKLPDGLLLGQDERLWNALAHVNPYDSNNTEKKTQVFIRDGLKLIGLDWIATNTCNYRADIGAFYKKAIEIRKQTSVSPPLPTLQPVNVIDKDLSTNAIFDGPIDELLKSTARVADMKKQIREHGVIWIRNALRKIPNDALSIRRSSKTSKLCKTTGNGLEGEIDEKDKSKSYYCDASSESSNFWVESVQNPILESFLSKADYEVVKHKKKTIILKYTCGSENWAHLDNNQCEKFPYQATVILNDGFKGGEFYVAKRNEEDGPPIVRTKVDFGSHRQKKGDMVIFAASKESKIYHGMMEVTEGERHAAGLFQNVG